MRILLTITFLSIAVAARADDSGGVPATCESPTAGLAVYLDPDGHPIVPGPDTPLVTLSQPTTNLRAGAPATTIENAPGGGKMVRLGRRLATMSVGRVDENGSVSIECIEQPGAAGK